MTWWWEGVSIISINATCRKRGMAEFNQLLAIYNPTAKDYKDTF